MIKPVTMYSVVCDRCGKTFEADGNIAWTDRQAEQDISWHVWQKNRPH